MWSSVGHVQKCINISLPPKIKWNWQASWQKHKAVVKQMWWSYVCTNQHFLFYPNFVSKILGNIQVGLSVGPAGASAHFLKCTYNFPQWIKKNLLSSSILVSLRNKSRSKLYTLIGKGQLISKFLFGVIVSIKIATKILDFCPEIFCSFLQASWKLFGLSGDLVST